MSLALAASFTLGSTASSNFVPNAQQNGSFGATWAGTIDGGYWVRPAHVEPKRSEPHVPLAATFAASVAVDESIHEDDNEKLTYNKDLGKTSPLAKLGDNIGLAFSVPSMESWLLDAVKFYGIYIDSMCPDAIILYLSSCTELGLLSSNNMILLPQCAW